MKLEFISIKRVYKIIIVVLISLPFWTGKGFSQHRLSVSFDVIFRNEIRDFQDPQGYLVGGYMPRFALGGTLRYKFAPDFSVEAGIYETQFNRNVTGYYNEEGYQPIANSWFEGTDYRTLQIPLRVIYDVPLPVSFIEIGVVGGLNVYDLNANMNIVRQNQSVSFIPMNPRSPEEFTGTMDTYPVRKNSVAFEGGIEARVPLFWRLELLYRLSRLWGTSTMVRMEGNYGPMSNPDQYSFEASSMGSAVHHTFSLRYKFGEKWFED